MNFRRLLMLAGLVGITVLISTGIGKFETFRLAFAGAHWYIIPLLISVQLLSYWANAHFYQSFFAITKRDVPLLKLFQIAIAINFANAAVPSGGVAGATFLATATRDDVPPSQATLAQVARYIFTASTFVIIALTGFFLIAGSSKQTSSSIALVGLLVLALALGGTLIFITFTKRERLERFLTLFMSLLNRIWTKFLRRPKPLITNAQLQQNLDEFYRAYSEISSSRPVQARLFGWALAGNIFEVMTVYTVVLGFGYIINPGIIIAGYTLANLASTLGFITSGFGVYEAGMIGTFTALGLPFAVSFAVVIVYRALSLILFLPPGAYLYRKYLKTIPGSPKLARS